MNLVLSSTDVRKNWSETIDSVVRKKPVFLKRRKDILALLSLEQLDLILDSFQLHLKVFKEDDGSYTGSVEEIDVVGNAKDEEQLIDLIRSNLIEYADEYMENFEMYYHSSNRRKHFPYVYRILAHESDCENIKNILDIHTGVSSNA